MTGAEPRTTGAGQGPVMVDVDDDTGALILLAPRSLVGAEIEVSRVLCDGTHGPRSHVTVVARRLGDEVVHAAVYPSLVAGRWQLWSPDDGREVLAVDIPGGRVVEAWWPFSSPPHCSSC